MKDKLQVTERQFALTLALYPQELKTYLVYAQEPGLEVYEDPKIGLGVANRTAVAIVEIRHTVEKRYFVSNNAWSLAMGAVGVGNQQIGMFDRRSFEDPLNYGYHLEWEALAPAVWRAKKYADAVGEAVMGKININLPEGVQSMMWPHPAKEVHEFAPVLRAWTEMNMAETWKALVDFCRYANEHPHEEIKPMGYSHPFFLNL